MSRDPFESPPPSVSFRGKGRGYKVTLVVMEPAGMVKTRDFKTKGIAEPWSDGSPRMTAVIRVQHEGQTKSLWANKPGSLFSAIRDAQREAGTPIDKDGVLEIEIMDEEETDGLFPKKVYRATYTPPLATVEALNEEIPF